MNKKYAAVFLICFVVLAGFLAGVFAGGRAGRTGQNIRSTGAERPESITAATEQDAVENNRKKSSGEGTAGQKKNKKKEKVPGDGLYDFSLTKEEKEADFPLLLQTDERWAAVPYGSGKISTSACGPTCLSMAVISLTRDYQATPPIVAMYSAGAGYYYPGQGTSSGLFTGGASHFGLQCRKIAAEKTAMEKALDQGAVLILSLTHGHFTDTPSGHYILIYGYTGAGFRVNDPNSRKNSRVWDLDVFRGEIMGVYALEREKETGK